MSELDIYLTKNDSEKIVLSAIFNENELIKDCSLVPANFAVRKHQELFSAMKALDEKDLPIEHVSILEQVGLENGGRVGGLSYIMELLTYNFTAVNFGYHEELIVEYYRRRKVVEIAQNAIQDVLGSDADVVMRNLIDNVLLLEDQDKNEDDGHISKVMLEAYENLESNRKEEITGAPTGFHELDKMTSGLQRQDLVIVGGRPSMGKTAFSVGVCLNYAENKAKGGPIAMFSLEMRNRALALRMISNYAHIDGQVMRNPKSLEDNDWVKMTRAFGQLGSLPYHMFDDPGVNIAYIRRKLRMMKRLYPGQHVVVMIDYLQLIQGDPKFGGNRTQEISEISRSLKRLAREMDMTIIALSQLSRGVESRQDKRPMLGDLRESGQLEQDADVVMFLYRDDYYDKETVLQGLIEIIVAKQRNGPIGEVHLAFVKEYSKFVNIEK